jgi:hypothetical protein
MKIDIEKVLDFLRDSSAKYAQAKANRIYMEEYKSSLLAKLMQNAQLNGVTSAAGQERDARASNDYHVHLDGLREAVEAEETLRWQLIAAQAKCEVFRTLEASKRNELRNLT